MNLPEGWLSEEEAKELRRLAAGKRVLELGAWKGRSTVAMADVARYIVSVDRHQGIEGIEYSESLLDYLGAVRELENVAIVIASFQEIVPLLSQDFDMVFVDGDHDAMSAEKDATLAYKHVHEEGVVVFHDWDFQSVRTGVSRVFGKSKPNALVGSIASFQMKSFFE